MHVLLLARKHSHITVVSADLQGSSPYRFSEIAVFQWNVAVATLCLAVLTPSLAMQLGHLFWAQKHGKNW